MRGGSAGAERKIQSMVDASIWIHIWLMVEDVQTWLNMFKNMVS